MFSREELCFYCTSSYALFHRWVHWPSAWAKSAIKMYAFAYFCNLNLMTGRPAILFSTEPHWMYTVHCYFSEGWWSCLSRSCPGWTADHCRRGSTHTSWGHLDRWYSPCAGKDSQLIQNHLSCLYEFQNNFSVKWKKELMIWMSGFTTCA